MKMHKFKRIYEVSLTSAFFVLIFTFLGFTQIQESTSKYSYEQEVPTEIKPINKPPLLSFESPDFPIDPEAYILGPGDLIGIDVFSKVYVNLDLQVNPQNGIVFPQIGFISTMNHSISSFGQELQAILKRKMKCDSIKVYLEKGKSVRVAVHGAVKSPGVLLLASYSRLNDVLLKAEILPWGKYDEVNISNDGKERMVNPFKAMMTGDTTENPLVSSGTRIFVPSCMDNGPFAIYKNRAYTSKLCLPKGARVRDLPLLDKKGLEKLDYQFNVVIKREGQKLALDNYSGEIIQNGDSVIVNSGEAKIFVTGAVARPGPFLFEPSFSVLQYIALAGGEEWRGNSSNFKIFRDNVEVASANGFDLKPGDILFIPGRSVIRFNELLGALVAVATLMITAKTVGAF